MPPGLIVTLCILLFIILLLSLRASLIIEAKDDVALTLKIAFVKVKLYPKKTATPKRVIRAQKKAEKKKQKGKKKASPAPATNTAKKKKSFEEILRLVKMVTRILKSLVSRFPSYFRLKLSRIILVVGGPDAAQTAIRYGAVRTAVAYLVTLLEQFVSIKTTRKSELYVQPDFLNDRIDYDISIAFSTSVRALLAILLRSAFAYLKEHTQQKKTKSQLANASQEQR